MNLEIFKSSYGYYNLRTNEGRPTDEMVNYLKENGYRWSPKNKCWYPATNEAKDANLHDDFVVKFREKFFDSDLANSKTQVQSNQNQSVQEKSFGQELIEREERKSQWRKAHGLNENENHKEAEKLTVEKLVDYATDHVLGNQTLEKLSNNIKDEITKERTVKLEELIADLRERLRLQNEKIAQLENSNKELEEKLGNKKEHEVNEENIVAKKSAEREEQSLNYEQFQDIAFKNYNLPISDSIADTVIYTITSNDCNLYEKDGKFIIRAVDESSENDILLTAEDVLQQVQKTLEHWQEENNLSEHENERLSEIKEINEKIKLDNENQRKENARNLTNSRSGKIQSNKKQLTEIREKCREILKKSDSEITEDDKKILAQYEGAGGLKEENRSTSGILNEFYTPQNLVEKVWKIVDHYAPDAKTVLEPSAGIGKFANNRPQNDFTMHELDETSARINKILHPKANVIQGAYQKQFFDESERFRKIDFVQPKYDVVIGNPPYGKYNDKYKGLGEGKEFDRYEEYFISKGLDALKDEKSVLAFVVPSGFLKSANDNQKEILAQKGEIIDAYRLPEGTFGTTDVGTDIIVMKNWDEKKQKLDWRAKGNAAYQKAEIESWIENEAFKLSGDQWFKSHPEKILGKTVEFTDRFGKQATKVVVEDGLSVQDELDKIDGFVAEKAILNNPLEHEKLSDDYEMSEKEFANFTSNVRHAEEDFLQGKDHEDDEIAAGWANEDFERTQRLNEIISEIKKSDFKMEVSVENNLRKVVLTNKNGDEIFSEKETGNSIMPITSNVAAWANDLESENLKSLAEEYFNIISEDGVRSGDYVNKVFEKEEKQSKKTLSDISQTAENLASFLEEIADQLERMETNIRNENGWTSANDIVLSNENARKYISEIKERMTGEASAAKLTDQVFSNLEADNYHTLNDALGILGAYGTYYQQKVLEKLEKRPSHFLLPYDVAKEFVNKTAQSEEKSNELSSHQEITLTQDELSLAESVIPEAEYSTMLEYAARGEESDFYKQKIKNIATAVQNAPKLYETDGQNEHKIVLRYFHPTGSEAYITEIGENGEAFGFQCLNGDWQNAEWGILDLNETKNIPGMETDLYVQDGMTVERYLGKEHPELFPEYAENAEFQADDNYVHSEEFISKFGDWEKAARLKKLQNSEPVQIMGTEIPQSADIKEYKKNAIQYGKSLRGDYKNLDSGNEILLTTSKKGGGIYEILEHDYKDKEHLQSIAAIPQIIENGIYIASEKNEDVQKHPNVEKYEYYLCGLKIANDDYTVKAVVAKTVDGHRYYDHKLTDIEKGKLLDFMKKYSVHASSVSITTQTPDAERLQLKDKRLYQICQCPQISYLDENLVPTAETIKAVKDGKIFVEKDENGIQILHDDIKGILIGEELSEMFKAAEITNNSSEKPKTIKIPKNFLKDVDEIERAIPENYEPLENLIMDKRMFAIALDYIKEATEENKGMNWYGTHWQGVIEEMAKTRNVSSNEIIDIFYKSYQEINKNAYLKDLAEVEKRYADSSIDYLNSQLDFAKKFNYPMTQAAIENVIARKSQDKSVEQNSSEEIAAETEKKPELKTYHTLKESDVKDLEIVSDEEFSDIVDSIILNDYKNIPNAVRLPNLNAALSEKLGLEKDSAFILKKSATHIRPDRKNGYGQAFDTEEYRKIPEVIRKANFAVVDNYFQNFQIVFNDKNNDEKINKLVFNKDELGNYLVTIGKVDRESAFSEERNSVVAVGVAPTIQTLRTRASSTALRASTTTVDLNIAQEAEKSSGHVYFNNLSKEQQEEVIDGFRAADDQEMLETWQDELIDKYIKEHKLTNSDLDNHVIQKETDVAQNPPTDEWIGEYLQKNKVNFNTEYWQDIFSEIEQNSGNQETVSLEEIEKEKQLIQEKILQQKKELNNPANAQEFSVYPESRKEIQDYIEKLEKLSDDNIKNQIVWKKKNQKKNDELRDKVAEQILSESQKANVPQDGELMSYNDSHPEYTLTNKETNRRTAIRPAGKLAENVRKLGRLNSLAEANDVIERIRSQGFKILSTETRAVIYNADKFYDFDSYADSGKFNSETKSFEYNFDSRKLSDWDFKKYIDGGLKITKSMKEFEKIPAENKEQKIESSRPLGKIKLFSEEEQLKKYGITKDTHATYFVKSTAEFDQFADFEPITNLTGEEAIAKYKELQEKGVHCGIGINIEGDRVFDDKDGSGITVLVRNNEGLDTLNIYGDSFVKNLKESDQHSFDVLAAFDSLYKTAKSAGLDVENAPYIAEKENELLGTLANPNQIYDGYASKLATNFVLEKLKATGIEVVTDKEEFNRILEREQNLQKMAGTLTPEEQKRYFTFNDEETKLFRKQVDEWKTDKSNIAKLITIGKIPPVMKVLGFPDNPIEIQHSTLSKAMRPIPQGYLNEAQGHALTIDDIYSIPEQLADPVMVFKSRTRNDSYVFFTERKDSQNHSILIPMAVNKHKGRIVINEITSMYGKDNETDFVKKNIDEDNLIYVDKKRSTEWERSSHVQFVTQRLSNSNAYNINILTKERLVNFISANSQQQPLQKMTAPRADVLSPDLKGFKNIADRICAIDESAQKRIGAEKIKTDTKAAEEYFSFLKSHIDSVSSLSTSVFNELENRNRHTATAALSIMGYFGEENQKYFVERSDRNKENPDNYDFPTEVVAKEIEDANLKNTTKIQKMSLSSDRGYIYGFAYNGKIYLNPNFLNSNVAVHEYTHLWDEYTRRTNPELWQKGMDILKGTKYFNEVKNDPNYADIADNDDLVLSELHARICGEMAQKVLERIAKEDGEITKEKAIDWNAECAAYILEFVKEANPENEFIQEMEASDIRKDMVEFFAQPIKDLISKKNISLNQNKEQKTQEQIVTENQSQQNQNHETAEAAVKPEKSKQNIAKSKGEVMNAEEFSHLYGKDFDEREFPIWKATDWQGNIDLSKLTDEEKAYLAVSENYVEIEIGKFTHRVLFESGDITAKIEDYKTKLSLIKNREEEAEKIKLYEKNIDKLEKVACPKIPMERLHFGVNSTLAEEFTIEHKNSEGQIEKLNLQESFILWAKGMTYAEATDGYYWRNGIDFATANISQEDLPENVSWYDIVEYIDKKSVKAERVNTWRKSEEEISADKAQKRKEAEEKRMARSETADRLFDKYIHEGLSPETSAKIESEYNRRFATCKD